MPAEKSLLGTVYYWIFSKFSGQSAWPALKELALTGIERMREESLELNFDETGGYRCYTFAAQYKSIVRILGRLNLDVFARLGITREDEAETTNFIATVGTNLNVNY
jgi:hypothetical protein